MKKRYILLSHAPAHQAQRHLTEQLAGNRPTQVLQNGTPGHIRRQVEESSYLLLLPCYRLYEHAIYAKYTAIELGKHIRCLSEPMPEALVQILSTELPHFRRVGSSKAHAVSDRKIATYILHHYTNLTLRQISQIVPVSTTTIGYYIRYVEQSHHYDPQLHRQLRKVLETIHNTFTIHESSN